MEIRIPFAEDIVEVDTGFFPSQPGKNNCIKKIRIESLSIEMNCYLIIYRQRITLIDSHDIRDRNVFTLQNLNHFNINILNVNKW